MIECLFYVIFLGSSGDLANVIMTLKCNMASLFTSLEASVTNFHSILECNTSFSTNLRSRNPNLALDLCYNTFLHVKSMTWTFLMEN